jgi:uncharacterized iron-regulated protein
MKRAWVGMFFAGVCATASAVAGSGGWDGRVFRPSSQAEISFDELLEGLSEASIVALGEKHSTVPVQLMEARIIASVVQATGKQGAFTTAWEFLNATTQTATATAFARVVAGELSVMDFLVLTQGKGADPSYVPVIQSTADLGGDLHGVNLSRAEKAPVVKGGIAAADPALVPPGFALGGAGYYERFYETMQGHATPDQIRNYYDAQCLTDDVMAYHLLEDPVASKAGLRFLVAGSFHTDYFDGAVARLKVRSPASTVRTVRIFDASDYTEAELPALLRDSRYGEVSDFAVFVGEPSKLAP